MTTPIEELKKATHFERKWFVNSIAEDGRIQAENMAVVAFNAGLDAAAEEVAKCQPSRPGLRDAILKRKL